MDYFSTGVVPVAGKERRLREELRDSIHSCVEAHFNAFEARQWQPSEETGFDWNVDPGTGSIDIIALMDKVQEVIADKYKGYTFGGEYIQYIRLMLAKFTSGVQLVCSDDHTLKRELKAARNRVVRVSNMLLESQTAVKDKLKELQVPIEEE